MATHLEQDIIHREHRTERSLAAFALAITALVIGIGIALYLVYR